MELRQLEHFIAVAEELHFTRAAARAHLVQSSLSASIAALERDVGAALFVRDSRRVWLTDAGAALLPEARRTLRAAEEARDAVAGVRGVIRGRLRIGAIQTLGVVDLPALVARFRQRHPAVTVQLSHTSAADLAHQVALANLDTALVDGPMDAARLHSIELGHDELILAVAATDPLAGRHLTPLGSPELSDRDFIEYRADSALRSQIDVACAEAGLARRIVCEVGSMPYLVDCVRHGVGVALLPPMAIRGTPDIVGVTITPSIRRHISAVVSARHTASPAAKAFLHLLPEHRTTESPRLGNP